MWLQNVTGKRSYHQIPWRLEAEKSSVKTLLLWKLTKLRQLCCRGAGQFSERSDNSKHISRVSLLWRHNGHDGVSNHQPCDCLLNRLFRRRSKKTSKLRVTGLCVGNSPVTGGPVARKMFPFDEVIMSQDLVVRHFTCLMNGCPKLLISVSIFLTNCGKISIICGFKKVYIDIANVDIANVQIWSLWYKPLVLDFIHENDTTPSVLQYLLCHTCTHTLCGGWVLKAKIIQCWWMDTFVVTSMWWI